MLPPAVAGGAWLVATTPGVGARAVVALYATSVVMMFAVSAAFHLRRWSDEGWLRMRRWDHTAIFVLIAGSYGAIMGLGVPGWPRTWLVGAAVVLCALGIAVRWLLLHPPLPADDDAVCDHRWRVADRHLPDPARLGVLGTTSCSLAAPSTAWVHWLWACAARIRGPDGSGITRCGT